MKTKLIIATLFAIIINYAAFAVERHSILISVYTENGEITSDSESYGTKTLKTVFVEIIKTLK